MSDYSWESSQHPLRKSESSNLGKLILRVLRFQHGTLGIILACNEVVSYNPFKRSLYDAPVTLTSSDAPVTPTQLAGSEPHGWPTPRAKAPRLCRPLSWEITGKSVYLFVVWSFLLFGLFGWFLLFGPVCVCVCVFAVWAGPWAGQRAAPKQHKKQRKHGPAPYPSLHGRIDFQQNTHSRREHIYVFAAGAGGVFMLLLFGRAGERACLFLLLFG